MGKVFLWSRIENHQIPDPKSFLVVLDKIKQDFESFGGIIGGIICGSVLWNNWSSRSDIDCVLVYKDIDEENTFKMLQDINLFAKKLYVPVEFIPFSESIAKTSIHHIGITFTKHLSLCVKRGGVIKTNPLSFFSSHQRNMKEDVFDYIRSKLRTLNKGLVKMSVMEDELLYIFFQKVMETAVHTARKILYIKGVDLQNDSKEEVVKKYLEFCDEKEAELFKKLVWADKEYTKNLYFQVSNPDKGVYQEEIEKIKDLVSDILKFIELCALKLCH